MGLIGRQETTGAFAKLDDITSLFDGNATVFNLTLGGQFFFPSNPFTLLVSVAGVVQEPATDYTIVESAIKFTTPPANGASGFIVVLSTPSTSVVNSGNSGGGNSGGGGGSSAGEVVNYSDGTASPFVLSIGRVTQSINLDDTVANEDANIVVGGATIVIDEGVTVTVGEGKRLVSDLFEIVSDAFPISESY
tara:strand:+ start:740 stop:1315 length:576 start_codon:yes stop_codon:yes gene_type:complete